MFRRNLLPNKINKLAHHNSHMNLTHLLWLCLACSSRPFNWYSELRLQCVLFRIEKWGFLAVIVFLIVFFSKENSGLRDVEADGCQMIYCCLLECVRADVHMCAHWHYFHFEGHFVTVTWALPRRSNGPAASRFNLTTTVYSCQYKD